MVADLCHFMFSCLRPERQKAKTRKHVFLSLFGLSGRRHENTKYARRNNNILTGEGTKMSLLNVSRRRVEIFRVVALYCVFTLKREGRNNDKKTCFVFSPFAPKTQNMSFCRYLDFRLAGRRHENTKYTRRNNDILTGEGTKISLLKILCRRVEIFHVVALCLSCLRVETRRSK